MEQVSRRFEQFGFPLVVDKEIVPDDDSTLFVCSGMQRVRKRFTDGNGGRHGSLQSCIRTNDLELVGDGTHLTYFEMLGNFSFGGRDYETSVEMWDAIVRDLGLPITKVTVHPARQDHEGMWRSRGYEVVLDPSCEWSDGEIGGNCCELFVGDLEVGNLVNPLGTSTDVGFGWERICQVVEGASRVDGTSLFRKGVHPVVADHCRTLEALHERGIAPGSKGRNYACRRLVRRILDLVGGERFKFDEWLGPERLLREDKVRVARRGWRKFKGRPPQFWWETYGVLPEELGLLE